MPTGRPDSPSGLDMTKSGVLPDFPYQRQMPRQTSRGINPVKLAEDSFTGRVDLPGMVNRVLSSMDASQDDPLAVEMAEGMRSTSARDAFFGLRFLCVQKR